MSNFTTFYAPKPVFVVFQPITARCRSIFGLFGQTDSKIRVLGPPQAKPRANLRSERNRRIEPAILMERYVENVTHRLVFTTFLPLPRGRGGGHCSPGEAI